MHETNKTEPKDNSDTPLSVSGLHKLKQRIVATWQSVVKRGLIGFQPNGGAKTPGPLRGPLDLVFASSWQQALTKDGWANWQLP